MDRMQHASRAIAAAAMLLFSWPQGSAPAQDLEPRLYTNVPLGIHFVGAGYGYSDGNVLFDPAVALENAEIEIDGPVLGYGRSIRLGPFSGKVDGAIAHVCLDGSADFEGERVTRNVCGWTDARARVTVNFIGAPPLTRQEFAGYRPDWVFGASLQLGVPVGDYDPTRLVNIGANRESAKLEVGVSKTLERWLLEVSLADTFYDDNTNFFRRPCPRARVDRIAARARRLSVHVGHVARDRRDALPRRGDDNERRAQQRSTVEHAARAHGLAADQREAVREARREHGRVDAHGHGLRHARRGLAVRLGRTVAAVSGDRTCARGRTS
jgi:hypothetical protein